MREPGLLFCLERKWVEGRLITSDGKSFPCLTITSTTVQSMPSGCFYLHLQRQLCVYLCMKLSDSPHLQHLIYLAMQPNADNQLKCFFPPVWGIWVSWPSSQICLDMQLWYDAPFKERLQNILLNKYIHSTCVEPWGVSWKEAISTISYI